MRTILFIVAAIMLIGWGIGLAFKVAGGFIHILLVIAVISIIVSFIKGRKSV